MFGRSFIGGSLPSQTTRRYGIVAPSMSARSHAISMCLGCRRARLIENPAASSVRLSVAVWRLTSNAVRSSSVPTVTDARAPSSAAFCVFRAAKEERETGMCAKSYHRKVGVFSSAQPRAQINWDWPVVGDWPSSEVARSPSVQPGQS